MKLQDGLDEITGTSKAGGPSTLWTVVGVVYPRPDTLGMVLVIGGVSRGGYGTI